MVHDLAATGVTTAFQRLLYCDVESKHKSAKLQLSWIASLQKQTNARLFLWRQQQSGGKLLHHLDLRVVVVVVMGSFRGGTMR